MTLVCVCAGAPGVDLEFSRALVLEPKSKSHSVLRSSSGSGSVERNGAEVVERRLVRDVPDAPLGRQWRPLRDPELEALQEVREEEEELLARELLSQARAPT